MLKILYRPSFLRRYAKLPTELQDEVKEKIALFQKDPHHPSLRTHKLKGTLRGRLSFSVNYQYRILFCFESERRVALLSVGDHDVYK